MLARLRLWNGRGHYIFNIERLDEFGDGGRVGVPNDQQYFIRLNAELARNWSSITKTKEPFAEADQFKDLKDKLRLLKR